MSELKSEVWKPQMDFKEVKIDQEVFEEPASHLQLQSLL